MAQKVYICCHEKDNPSYYKDIKKEITKVAGNCQIFDNLENRPEDSQDGFDVLSQMNLFVAVVTYDFLTDNESQAFKDFLHAKELKKAIIPVVYEYGLEDLFNEKCGQIQFLVRYGIDKTAIPFEQRFEKNLKSILLDDKTIKRILEEFKATMFLSYRKMDRVYAQRLIEAIHKNDFYRDMAIWYDEFLTPGEDFNTEIAEKIKDSDIFALAITPNLLAKNALGEKNYVVQHEYPQACESHLSNGNKSIAGVEMADTDPNALKREMPDVTNVIKFEDEQEDIAESLKSLLPEKVRANLENSDNTPEHLYLMGLAYLDGTNVEFNFEKAVELLKKADSLGYFDATVKLAQMYEKGDGVNIDYNMALEYYDKVIDVIQKQKLYETDVTCIKYWFNYIVFLNDINLADWIAEKITTLGEELAVLCNYKNNSIDINNKAHLYDIIANVYKKQTHHKKAEYYFMRFIEFLERLVMEKPEDNEERFVDACYRVADYFAEQKNFKKAEECYLKGIKVQEKQEKENPEEFPTGDLALVYGDLYYIYEQQNNTTEVEVAYLKALSFWEKYSKKYPKHNNSDAIISVLERLGDFYRKKEQPEKSEEYYLKIIEIRKQVANENYQKHGGKLAQEYCRIAEVYQIQSQTEKAIEYYMKGIEIYTQLLKNEPEKYIDIITCRYAAVADMYYQLGNLEKLEEIFLIIIRLFEQQAQVNPEGYYSRVAKCYNRLAVILLSKGERERSYQYRLKAQELENSQYAPTFRQAVDSALEKLKEQGQI